MVDLTFPLERFREAGATPEELAELRSQFRRSDVIIQRQQVEFWAGKPTSALRDYLDTRREVGDLNGAPPVGLAANTSEGPETSPEGENDDEIPEDDLFKAMKHDEDEEPHGDHDEE
jgi:hypothetical protein